MRILRRMRFLRWMQRLRQRKQGTVMIKTILAIEGMSCAMCEAHICETIRKAVPAARKAAASRRKKAASFLTEAQVDAGLLKSAIDATGYSCLSVALNPYEKKALFG